MLKKYSFFFLSILICIELGWGQQTHRVGRGNLSNVNVTTSNNQPTEPGENTLGGTGILPNLNAASRFLGHATLGADYELIQPCSLPVASIILRQRSIIILHEKESMSTKKPQDEYLVIHYQDISSLDIQFGLGQSTIVSMRVLNSNGDRIISFFDETKMKRGQYIKKIPTGKLLPNNYLIEL